MDAIIKFRLLKTKLSDLILPVLTIPEQDIDAELKDLKWDSVLNSVTWSSIHSQIEYEYPKKLHIIVKEIKKSYYYDYTYNLDPRYHMFNNVTALQLPNGQLTVEERTSVHPSQDSVTLEIYSPFLSATITRPIENLDFSDLDEKNKRLRKQSRKKLSKVSG